MVKEDENKHRRAIARQKTIFKNGSCFASTAQNLVIRGINPPRRNIAIKPVAAHNSGG
ncbi:MAG: hypothetical protein ACI4VB_10675 [Bradymonadia bacterium]